MAHVPDDRYDNALRSSMNRNAFKTMVSLGDELLRHPMLGC